jgi:hypothetical protein
MRRVAVLVGLAAVGWWWLSRRRSADERVVIGYEDGSSFEPPEGSREWRELLRLAREAQPE